MVTTTSYLGHRVARLEDPPLLTGTARYLADLAPEGWLAATFVRSPVAHARLGRIDASEALGLPGVVAVLSAADLDLPDLAEWPPPPGGPRRALARPVLAREVVRFVGEAIAVVLAERPALAEDAAGLVVVELDPILAVTEPERALGPDAPLLAPEHESNVVVELAPIVDDDPLAGADVVVRAELVNQRVAAVPIEPNGALAIPGEDGTLELWVSSQAPFQVRDSVARALGLDPSMVRVRVPAVGGGFGAKGGTYPEQVVVAAAALVVGRPVRYVETRSENLVAMTQGRDQHQSVELGATRDGKLCGLRVRTVNNVGAYAFRGRIAVMTSRTMATGVYVVPRLHHEAIGVLTNTSPVGPYRGAGRPEATAMLERAMDLLAGELGLDPVELRRRNLIPAASFPYVTHSGATYDSGNYEASLDRCCELAGYDALRGEQQQRRAMGDRRLMGIGVATFVEVSGSGTEFGEVAIGPDGDVTVFTGASPHGQGLATALAQVVASVLEVPIEAITVRHSDTSVVQRGIGTFGSRSGQLAGSAALGAAELVLDKARRLAAELLEVAPEDLVRGADGDFAVIGVPSASIGLGELARRSLDGGGLATDLAGGLRAELDFAQPEGSFPFGAHLAVVDVDEETGAVSLRRFIAVDDCGVIVNPVIVEGQTHGGIAQGIAQALYEQVVYDEAGNPLTTTLADYLVPSAADLVSFEIDHTVTPSPRNPLGMKGIGESGTVGATAAVHNAVLDALAPLGVRHIDLPLSPEAVVRAIVAAQAEPATSDRSPATDPLPARRRP
jgi:carbon-monoxide dehydrogenase large subunit